MKGWANNNSNVSQSRQLPHGASVSSKSQTWSQNQTKKAQDKSVGAMIWTSCSDRSRGDLCNVNCNLWPYSITQNMLFAHWLCKLSRYYKHDRMCLPTRPGLGLMPPETDSSCRSKVDSSTFHSQHCSMKWVARKNLDLPVHCALQHLICLYLAQQEVCFLSLWPNRWTYVLHSLKKNQRNCLESLAHFQQGRNHLGAFVCFQISILQYFLEEKSSVNQAFPCTFLSWDWAIHWAILSISLQPDLCVTYEKVVIKISYKLYYLLLARQEININNAFLGIYIIIVQYLYIAGFTDSQWMTSGITIKKN